MSFAVLQEWAGPSSAFFAGISALLAACALVFHARMQKRILVHSLHEHFFRIQSEAAANFTQKNNKKYNELISNFLEYICHLVNKRKIKLRDVELMHATMLKLWDTYGARKNETNPDTYKNWKNVINLLG